MDDAQRTKIIANSTRLIRDAKFLSDSDRCASAFALAVLGLEEIGKVILDIWSEQGVQADDRRLSAHLRKQTAVASLLLAVKGVAEILKSSPDRPVTEEFKNEVAKVLFESQDGQFSEVVRLGALDKTKQAAFYHDDWLDEIGIHPDQFQRSDVQSLFDKSRSAVSAMANRDYMRVGKAIYLAQIPFLTGKRDRPTK